MLAILRRHIVILRVPTWGFDLGEARFYGWWGFLQIGPWTIWIGNVGPELEKCRGCLDRPLRRNPCFNYPNCRDRRANDDEVTF